jgi:hypothetical protein
MAPDWYSWSVVGNSVRHRMQVRFAMCLLVAALAGCDGSSGPAKTASAASTSTSVPADTTTGGTVPGSTVATTGSTTGSTVTKSSPTTKQVSPAGACANGTDPKCGPFYWTPQPPPNQPLTLTVTAQPASARVGQDIVFTVTFADPDAGQPAGCGTESQMYGDGSPSHQLICDDASTCTWTGSHTPPPPMGGRWTMSYHHIYPRAGKFVASFMGTSRTLGAQAHCVDAHTGRPGDPFASTGTADTSVTVS